MKIIYYDLYYTVIETRDENRYINIQNENDYNDYIIINDFINPNHYVGTKSRETILWKVEKNETLYKSVQVFLTI